MAFIANTAFEARITNNRTHDLVNIAGKYEESSAVADCSAGIICVAGDLLDCEGFTGVKNENTHKMTAAGATDKEPLYACNTYETKKVGAYYIGRETLGLGVEAGKYGNFTLINFDGQSVYRFGIGNVTGAIGDKTYFTIASGKLVPATSAPSTAGLPYFKLRGTGNFIEGTRTSFGYVDVVACRA